MPELLFSRCVSGDAADLSLPLDPVQVAIDEFSEPTLVHEPASLGDHVVFKVEKTNPEGRAHVELHHVGHAKFAVHVNMFSCIGTAHGPPFQKIVQVKPMGVRVLDVGILVSSMTEAMRTCMQWFKKGREFRTTCRCPGAS